MIIERTTVVCWQDGVAVLSREKASCQGCSSRPCCGGTLFSGLNSNSSQIVRLPCEIPVVPGQRVELGIAQATLFRTAFLTYIMPLIFLFSLAGLFQTLFNSELAAAVGAVIGGAVGFGILKVVSCFYEPIQPKILKIMPPETHLPN